MVYRNVFDFILCIIILILTVSNFQIRNKYNESLKSIEMKLKVEENRVIELEKNIEAQISISKKNDLIIQELSDRIEIMSNK
ncbi:MAG: hypothetical protein JEY91_18510 [Spirochaetaceae bacterium]|nr:hypothetical protein [Spirochaetaceae bacterium]